MWTYILGPFLSLLPLRWRAPVAELPISWPQATLVSGLAQGFVCLLALIGWYLDSMQARVREQLDVTVEAAGGIPGEGAAFGMGAAALSVFLLHPLTWALAYFSFEGGLRAAAAGLADESPATLPLVAVARLLRGRRPRSDWRPQEPGFFTVTLGALHYRYLLWRSPLIPDEIHYDEEAGERMEIHSCRLKADWIPPRIVLFENEYYRLEATARGRPPRPFHFYLTRLPAGVPGRRVLRYSPEDPLRIEG